MVVEVIAFLYPAKQHVERVRSMLQSHVEYVKENEPGTLKYLLYKETKNDNFVMTESYKDQASLLAHAKDAKFKKMGTRMDEEGLLAKPTSAIIVKVEGGFTSKL